MKHSHNPETQYDEPASIAIGYSQIMARQLGLNEKNLEVLLERTGLSVEELMDDETLLTKRQQLKWLYLRVTKVTKAGVAELRKVLPKCKIYH